MATRVWAGVELAGKTRGEAREAVQDDLPTKIMGEGGESSKKLLGKSPETLPALPEEQGSWLSKKVQMAGRRVQDAIRRVWPDEADCSHDWPFAVWLLQARACAPGHARASENPVG